MPFDEHGRIQLYDGVRPQEEISSQYGTISCLEWVRKEKERIEHKGGDCEIKEVNGRLELWVVPVASVDYTRKYRP